MGVEIGRRRSGHFRLGSVILLNFLFLLVGLGSTVQGQVTTAITPDGTLGSTVTQAGNVYNIDEGTVNGSNQFHSLSLFSVGPGDVASFNGPSSISNILSRVTGGVISSIDGTIQTTIPGANLFVMNPAGMVFGPNASLNVSGAVHFATSDSLRLADGGRFNAMPGPSDALLTSAPVEAFGFLNDSPEGITLDRSSLKVAEGETLSLIGGDIKIVGNSDQPPDETIPSLASEGGRVNLISVASAGEMDINSLDNDPDFRFNSFERLGEITLSKAASVDTSGDGGGTVVIRGGHLTIDESRISANTTGSAEGPFEDQSGIGIDIQVSGNLFLDNESVIVANVLGGSMDGGDIIINAGQTLEVRSDSMVQTQALGGSGNAGSIEAYADKLLISDSFRAVESLAFAPSTGDAGNIRITAKNLHMAGGGITATSVMGVGQAGSIDVNVQGGEIFLDRSVISANSFGASGNSGQVQITAGNLFLTNSANIESASFGGATGNTGSVRVGVSGQLDIRERSSINVRSEITGADGDLTITAKDIVITGVSNGDFTGLSTLTSNGPGADIIIKADALRATDKGSINGSTNGTGASGNLSIDLSGDLVLADGARIDAVTSGTGPAGKITILSAGNILLSNGSSIKAESASRGNAGEIRLTSNNSILIINSAVTAEATVSDGGNIKLTAPDTIRLIDSELTTSVGGGPQTEGGNINIDPRFVILENSRIAANAFEGKGGEINITAGALLANPASVIDASSQFGISGNVEINSPDTNIIEGTLELPESFLNVQSLLSTRCASRTTKPASSFFVTNGRLPLGPDTLIPAGVTGVGINSGGSDGPQSDQSDEIPELLVQTSAFGGCTDEMM